MSVASSVGLILGVALLALGLTLLLLPLNFQSSSPTPVGPFLHASDAAILRIQVPNASFSLGGASLSVSWTTSSSTPVTSFLYPLDEGEVVWSGGVGTTPPLADVTTASSSGMLTPSTPLTPGAWYALVVFENSSENAYVNATWTGSLYYPYAEIGIPLAAIGAVVVITAVALTRPRPTKEESSPEYATVPEVSIAGPETAQAYDLATVPVEIPPPATPPVLVPSPPPQALPAPVVVPSPVPLSAPLAPTPPSSATQPPIVLRPDEPPPSATRGGWKATPLSRPSPAPASGASQKELAPGRPSVAGGPSATGTTTGGPKCPRCGLAVGDESWAFCPRCRAELE